MLRYQVIDYKEVVQNDEGQWAVTQTESKDIFVEIEDNAEPREVCKTLKAEGVINTSDMRKIQMTDLGSDIVEIKEKKTGCPICRLEKRRFIR